MDDFKKYVPLNDAVLRLGIVVASCILLRARGVDVVLSMVSTLHSRCIGSLDGVREACGPT